MPAAYASDRLRLLSRWLVARVLAISFAAVVLTQAFQHWLGPVASSALAVLGSVLVYATFAEVIGTIARRRPEHVGRLALRYLKPLELGVLPVAEPLAILGRWVGRRIPDDGPADARLTETEVEAIARMANVSEEILRIVGNTRAWVKNYNVVLGLVRNPKTPVALSMNLLGRLTDKDLKQISTNRNVPEVLRVTARKKVVIDK